MLANLLADFDSKQEETITATVLLSSYELLSAPGSKHRRHLHCLSILFETRGIYGASEGLERASFWTYARQDVAMALMNECRPQLNAGNWNVTWMANMTEDMVGNHMLYLLNRVVALVFDKGVVSDCSMTSRPPTIDDDSVHLGLITDVKRWRLDDLNDWYKGIPCGSTSTEGFIELWFPIPISAAAMLLYHLAMLLLSLPGPSSDVLRGKTIQYHADQIGCIVVSKIPDSVRVQAVQPVYFGNAQLQNDALCPQLIF
ncbi:hypothetical protein MMC28_001144 [Mycoblastus sanguinarius]|nr:hypothetical protein [Mycoblastus sanguinarius]